MTENIKIAVNDAEPLPGHWGNLTPEQMTIFKNIWKRLIKLFEQDEPTKEAEEEPAKTGWFGRKQQPEKSTELFFGATGEYKLMNVPLEKAIASLSGARLRRTFYHMVSADNPDAVILRYCRARKWHEDQIYDMLVNTLRWRISARLDDIISLGENGLRDEYNSLSEGWGDKLVGLLHSGLVFITGPDKESRSAVYVNVFKHFKENQAQEVVKAVTLYELEVFRAIVHQPVETCCVVFNLENFALKNMDFEFLKFFLYCLEQHYPETLGVLLIYKAPWVFFTIWHLITPLLDPVVASKIHFIRNLDELKEKVPEDAIPGILMGDEEKLAKSMMLPDEPLQPGKMGVPQTEPYREYEAMIEQYEAATAKWLSLEEEVETAVSDRRALACQLRHARFRAEPDIRGPTTYSAQDVGRITPEGRCILDYGNPAWVPLDITDAV